MQSQAAVSLSTARFSRTTLPRLVAALAVSVADIERALAGATVSDKT